MRNQLLEMQTLSSPMITTTDQPPMSSSAVDRMNADQLPSYSKAMANSDQTNSPLLNPTSQFYAPAQEIPPPPPPPPSGVCYPVQGVYYPTNPSVPSYFTPALPGSTPQESETLVRWKNWALFLATWAQCSTCFCFCTIPALVCAWRYPGGPSALSGYKKAVCLSLSSIAFTIIWVTVVLVMVNIGDRAMNDCARIRNEHDRYHSCANYTQAYCEAGQSNWTNVGIGPGTCFDLCCHQNGFTKLYST